MTRLMLLAVACLMLAGCSDKKEAYKPQLEWNFATKNDLAKVEARVEGRLDAMQDQINARAIPQQTARNTTSYTPMSWEQEIDPQDEPGLDEEAVKALVKNAVQEQLKSVEVPAVSSSLPDGTYEMDIQPAHSSAPTYSSGQTYSAGPKTYGAAVQSGFKTTYRTVQKQVAKQVPKTVMETVYETIAEQVPVKIPVVTRPVYQTVQEQVPVQVQKTRMKTEMRTRTKTVMVPQQVEEQYAVQVPETVTETVMQTRTKQVKVGEEEVTAPTYSAAPEICCEPVQSYSSVPSFSATPAIVSAPAYSTAEFCEPASYSQVSYSTAPATVSTTRFATAARPRLFSSTANSPRLQPFKAVRNAVSRPVSAVNTFSANRTQAVKSRGGEGIVCEDCANGMQ